MARLYAVLFTIIEFCHILLINMGLFNNIPTFKFLFCMVVTFTTSQNVPNYSDFPVKILAFSRLVTTEIGNVFGAF